MTIRTRFAPSPTGYLHIGGVRTALFNWLLARQAGGQFILRIDDTDAQRNVAQALQPILNGFKWLGLDWDEGPTADGLDSIGPHGPYFQSQRGELYKAAAKKLLDDGFAYRDYASTDELAVQRNAAEKAGTTFVYDRQWMAETDQQASAFEAEGRTAVVRLKMPREGTCVFSDEVRGTVEVNWADEQDHVIQRADGSCLYHLASVVDDHAMEITHVVRAVEHLSNTPRQIFIAQSLGFELPVYAHLPFVSEPGGTPKLSKRKLAKYLKNKGFAELNALGQSIAEKAGLEASPDTFNPVIIDFYQAIGFLPAAILNYLILLGWSLDDSTEDFSIEQMIELFSTSRITKAPASFSPQKLTAFQTRWMQKLSVDERAAMCLPYLVSAGIATEAGLDRVKAIIAGAGDRIKVAGDIVEYGDFFAADNALDYDEAAFEKRIKNDPLGIDLLRKLTPTLQGLEEFDAASIENCVKQTVESEGMKIKHIIHALRIATTGKSVGFGMFDTLAILGRESALARIRHSLDRIA